MQRSTNEAIVFVEYYAAIACISQGGKFEIADVGLHGQDSPSPRTHCGRSHTHDCDGREEEARVEEGIERNEGAGEIEGHLQVQRVSGGALKHPATSPAISHEMSTFARIVSAP
jgi:hypothetical protein